MISMESSELTRLNNITNEAISNLLDHISGDLSEYSLKELKNISSKNQFIFDKIISKIEKFNLNIKAQNIELILKALNLQQEIPNNILHSISYHLIDQRFNDISNILQIFAANLEQQLPENDPVKATIFLANNLNIYTSETPAEHFLRAVITMLLNFNNKEHKKKIENDSAKWLKNLLAISDKSPIIKLIDYIAIRLQISGISVEGRKYCELTEIYYLFEEAYANFNLVTKDSESKQFIKKINAIVLFTIICKKNPNSLLDICELQIESKNLNIQGLLNQFSINDKELNNYLICSNFVSYYKCRNISLDKMASHQTFLQTLTNSINDYSNGLNKNEMLGNFFSACNKMNHELSDDEFTRWTNNLQISNSIIEEINANFFDNAENQLKTKIIKNGGLSFITNKLISLGFSPRSVSTSHTGGFQPLITPLTLNLDLTNFLNFKDYYLNLNLDKQKSLFKNIVVANLLKYRASQNRLENQPKPVIKRPADTNYPIPTVHTNYANANSFKFYRKQQMKVSNFHGAIFSKSANVQKAQKVTPKHYCQNVSM